MNVINFLMVLVQMRHCYGNPIFLRLRAKFPSLWVLFVNTVFASLGQLCVLYTIHLSILIFNIAFQYGIRLTLPYPTLLRRLVLLQKRIVRIISKNGFDAHTDPLFKNIMILKLEDIYSLHLEKFMVFFSKITQFLLVFPDLFYALIKFMFITRVVQLDFIFLSAVPT